MDFKKTAEEVREKLEERWEKGIPHNPLSEALYRAIEKMDYESYGDSFCWKAGGDGDNGENLMYLLDEILDTPNNPVSLALSAAYQQGVEEERGRCIKIIELCEKEQNDALRQSGGEGKV